MTAQRPRILGAVARQGVTDARQTAHYRPGDVVWASVRQPLADHPEGKQRPVILLKQLQMMDGAAGWALMGLTTNPTFQNGTPRQPIRDWRGCGLNKPGFYWGRRPACVPESELFGRIGRVSMFDFQFLLSYSMTKMSTGRPK